MRVALWFQYSTPFLRKTTETLNIFRCAGCLDWNAMLPTRVSRQGEKWHLSSRKLTSERSGIATAPVGAMNSTFWESLSSPRKNKRKKENNRQNLMRKMIKRRVWHAFTFWSSSIKMRVWDTQISFSYAPFDQMAKRQFRKEPHEAQAGQAGASARGRLTRARTRALASSLKRLRSKASLDRFEFGDKKEQYYFRSFTTSVVYSEGIAGATPRFNFRQQKSSFSSGLNIDFSVNLSVSEWENSKFVKFREIDRKQ